MKKDEHLSEEQLNAFVDGELDPEEKSRLYNESAHSPELDQRLCQQRKLKELVQHAYEDVPPARGSGGAPIARRGFFGRALVASVLLAVGLAGGFIAHKFIVLNQSDESLIFAGGMQAASESNNYLLHVVSGEPEQMMAALAHARQLLESADEGEFRQVEIIANEQGLDLLRQDVTPFAEEIATLQRNDVVFYACSKTIERLEEKGVKVILVPETIPNYTALDRVVTRMQDGWKYEKI
jgi:intracellular sulfur oxidation DsrE/DsrF family protein